MFKGVRHCSHSDSNVWNAFTFFDPSDRGQTGGLDIHDSLLVSGLLTFPIVCHSGKRAKENLSVKCDDTQTITSKGSGLVLFAAAMGVLPGRENVSRR